MLGEEKISFHGGLDMETRGVSLAGCPGKKHRTLSRVMVSMVTWPAWVTVGYRGSSGFSKPQRWPQNQEPVLKPEHHVQSSLLPPESLWASCPPAWSVTWWQGLGGWGITPKSKAMKGHVPRPRMGFLHAVGDPWETLPLTLQHPFSRA